MRAMLEQLAVSPRSAKMGAALPGATIPDPNLFFALRTDLNCHNQQY